MEFLIYLGGFVVMMFLGIVFGTMAERRHLANLFRREDKCRDIIRTQSKRFIEPTGDLIPVMCCAETVIANDYFKRFLASFRMFFGGEIKAYNVLMERARRETLLKIIEQAEQFGYNAVCNVRLESADVGGNTNKKSASIICVMGSATAYNSKLAKLPKVPPRQSK